MTIQEFRSLSRGDILLAAGNGPCVVEGVFCQDSMTTVDLRLQRGRLDVVRGIPETAANVLAGIRKQPIKPD